MIYAPYDNPTVLTKYTWSANGFKVDVLRLPQDRHIGPDMRECLEAGMTPAQYDEVVRFWRQL